ncbi:MAG: hypothetical protein QOG31_1066 [Thermoplasmata archaeon]|jgi:hypothetical protein|nr:hypothetical protein [Thermoplasmata archaeon]
MGGRASGSEPEQARSAATRGKERAGGAVSAAVASDRLFLRGVWGPDGPQRLARGEMW